MKNHILINLCIALILITGLAVPASTSQAQNTGFSDTFDDPALPGWEHSPNTTIDNGWLRIEPGGFAFHGGQWNNQTISIAAMRLTGNGAIVIKYQATDQSGYILRFAVGSLELQRLSGDSKTELGTASLEIPPGEPATIVVSVSADQHQITVNGNAKISVTDPEPLPPGGLLLSAEDAVAEFDEISLSADSEAPPTQTPDAVPTTEISQSTTLPEEPITNGGTPAYQAKSWVALGGPPGDLGYDIRVNFDDPNTWYVTDGQGGFFISTDRGLTWKASNQGISPTEGTILRPVFSATVDPHNPQTIWIGTQITGHIYKSTDGGQTWIQKDNGVTPNQGHHFRGITVDPTSSDIAYAMAEVDCVLLSSNCPSPGPGQLPPQGGRVYRTTDGGENWEIIWQGDALARYLWIDPSNTNVMYVSTGIFDRPPMPSSPNGVGILKSADGGKTWRKLGKSNGLTHLHVGTLYMHPTDPLTLLAGTGISEQRVLDPETGKDVLDGGVFLTTDGGETWTKVIKNDTFGAVEFCDQDPRIAYAAGKEATYRSEDGGRTWQKFGDETRETWGPKGVFPGTPIDMQVDPGDCLRILLNNYIGGNFLSTDGAESWAIASTGYSGAQVYEVNVDPANASRIYATTRMAPFVSHDGGTTWQGLSDEVMKTSVASIAVDPSNINHLIASQGKKYLISQDGGKAWKAFEQFIPPADAPNVGYWMSFGKIVFAPSNPMILYAGSRNDARVDAELGGPPEKYPGLGIFRSDDGGETWNPANDVNTENEGIGPILIHPTDPQTVYAAGHFDAGMFKTTDGGKNWTPINNGLPQPFEMFYTMAMDPDSPDTIILLGKAGVFKTTDGGSSWTQLTGGIDSGSTYKAVVFDPTNGQVVYLGSSRLGAFYSTNGGETFQPLTQGMDTSLGGLPIKHFGISADGTVLYAATHGSGVWRLGTPQATTGMDSDLMAPTASPESSAPQPASPPPGSTPQTPGVQFPCSGAIAIPVGLIIAAQRRHQFRK